MGGSDGAVGVDDLDASVGGSSGDLPASFVDEVVFAADENKIVEVSSSAVFPPVDVVCVAPFAGGVAVVEDAGSVAYEQGVDLVLGGDAGASAHVEHLGGAFEEVGQDAGFASEASGGFDRDRCPVGELADTVVV